jgi:hypothetical protein
MPSMRVERRLEAAVSRHLEWQMRVQAEVVDWV